MSTYFNHSPRSGLRVVLRQELEELWLGSMGLAMLFGFTLLLSVLAYLSSADAAIDLLDARDSVGLVVQTSIGLGSLAALVASADAISGERERGTLESLLVTPVPRRHIVMGKLLAASTLWVAFVLAALPFVVVMASGPGVIRDAVLVLFVAGGLVAAALTALGIAISSLARSNRVSLASSVSVLLLLATPSQLPAVGSNGLIGLVLVRANPVSAGLRLAQNVIVSQQPWSDQWGFVVSPIVSAIGFTLLAVAMSSRLELGESR